MPVWEKLGLIYKVKNSNRHEKLISHAANPLPVHINGDVYRIFYSGRDSHNRSSVGAVDIDIKKRKIVQDYEDPFFVHGPENTFYADGISIGNCYMVEGNSYMLFMGWQNPIDSHWRGDLGRLVVHSDLTLSLDSIEPIIQTSQIDPLSFSYPYVLESPNGGFDMWYGSTQTWDAGNGEMLHVINHAYSTNGHDWKPTGLAVPNELGVAQAFSRPSVSKSSRGHEMWFSYRSGSGEKYRIGYATSENGSSWTLDLENSGIDVSKNGWDCEMIEYPFVFDHDEKTYMLYNGNDYGRSGFGLAVLGEP
jgi:hypothetical protein